MSTFAARAVALVLSIRPYAADNLLRLLGHHDRLGLNSWCRARFLKLYPRTRKTRLDAAIGRRYAPCAPYSALAMWLDLTHAPHPRTEHAGRCTSPLPSRRTRSTI